MCNVSISDSDSSLVYSCTCNIGYHLAEDMHNCVCEYFLISLKPFVRVIRVPVEY